MATKAELEETIKELKALILNQAEVQPVVPVVPLTPTVIQDPFP